MDLVAPTSNYMLERSLANDPSDKSAYFLPLDLIPLFFGLILTARRKTLSSRKTSLWLFLITSAIVLVLVAFYSNWSPHPWVLPWVLPVLIMIEIGTEQATALRYRWVPVMLMFLVIAFAFGQTVFLRSEIATNGGTGWHYPSLSTRRDVLKLISEREPRAKVVLANPGSQWTYSLVGWGALCSLPDEYLNKLSLGQSNVTVIIEELGVPGWDPKFQEKAHSIGATLIGKVASVRIWRTMTALQGEWPTVAAVTARARPSRSLAKE